MVVLLKLKSYSFYYIMEVEKMNFIKKTLTGFLSLAICTTMISSNVEALQASYYKGDINSDGVVNTNNNGHLQ